MSSFNDLIELWIDDRVFANTRGNGLLPIFRVFKASFIFDLQECGKFYHSVLIVSDL